MNISFESPASRWNQRQGRFSALYAIWSWFWNLAFAASALAVLGSFFVN